MTFEVLLVDDTPGVAEDYATMLSAKTNLTVVGTDDPLLALELAREHALKVAVLDQRMPERLGTTLYQDLKAINPYLKVMMLSGQAAAEEVAEAWKLQFDDYLHKSNLADLPARVEGLVAKYHAELALVDPREFGKPIFVERKWRAPFGGLLYFLVDACVLKEDLVLDWTWKTIGQVNAGEKIEHRDEFHIENQFVYSRSSKTTGGATLGVEAAELAGFKAGLESAVEQSWGLERTSTSKKSIEYKRTFQLPAEPTGVDTLYIKSRHYQRAPVFREIRCIVMRLCRCCGMREIFPVVVYRPSPKVATRQIDYLSDGSSRENRTGEQEYTSS